MCLSFIFGGEEAGVAMGWQCSLWSSPVARVTYLFFIFFFFLLSLLPISLFFSDHSGHRRRDRRPMWDSEKLYLTSPPCPPFLYPLSWPFPILLSLSFSFPDIEEGTCRLEVADSRTGLGDVLALPIFSLFIFVSVFLSFPLRQPSSRKLVFCYIFHSLCSLLFSLFFSDHSGHRRRDRRPMWDSEKLYLTSPPCPPFLYPLSWPFPHPSVPLFSFPGIEERTCRFEVADSRIGLADVLALPTFSLFSVLFSSPFLPTLFHLKFSFTRLANRLFGVVFHSILISVFFSFFSPWGLVVSNDLGGDHVWLLDWVPRRLVW